MEIETNRLEIGTEHAERAAQDAVPAGVGRGDQVGRNVRAARRHAGVLLLYQAAGPHQAGERGSDVDIDVDVDVGGGCLEREGTAVFDGFDGILPARRPRFLVCLAILL